MKKYIIEVKQIYIQRGDCMPRKAPEPSVRFYLNPQALEKEKKLRDNLSQAHIMAIRSFVSSLNLSNRDKENMKKLLP